MTREFILKHVGEAERHVAEGQHRIAQHRTFIERLGEIGGDTTNAGLLLDTLLGVQETHQRHLAYLRRLLEKSAYTDRGGSTF